MEDFDARLSHLLQWINSTPRDNKLPRESYISPNLAVQDVEGSGRGVYAKESIKPHSLIINIPHAFLLNFVTVLNHIAKYNGMKLEHQSRVPLDTIHDSYTKIYQKLSKDELLKLSSFQLLSMYITIERKRDTSYWKPFIDMLPTISDFSLMPINYDADTLDLLPKSTKSLHTKVLHRFNHDYQVILDLLGPKTEDVLSAIPKEDFLLSWLSINSRCLYMKLPTSSSAQDNFTMAPYIDFINHSPNDHCNLKIDGKGFQVFTTSSYSADEQLYFSYGPHSNDFLLTEYGFIVPENKWDDIDISEDILSLLKSNQKEFLKSHDYFGNYTVNREGLSFRTEVALATLQESAPQDSRRLIALINGNFDGSSYKAISFRIISDLLGKVIHQAEQYQYLQYSDDLNPTLMARKRTIGTLYWNRRQLAREVIDSLNQL
ncbi:Rkm2 protein [Candida orthopsilosis Co 90-125]|uniref:Rkm2 protein n=1 Tax=Candida orthopsilosis (strain 90-125) TaxID=1136231 RepID=H8X0V2_CANO9|nr:Rkm2 protein [Candida orthopsilosis Co 90-125]CCG21991.1 Rkm2 protein [Candida orthopsilosis Co 90-125]